MPVTGTRPHVGRNAVLVPTSSLPARAAGTTLPSPQRKISDALKTGCRSPMYRTVIGTTGKARRTSSPVCLCRTAGWRQSTTDLMVAPRGHCCLCSRAGSR